MDQVELGPSGAGATATSAAAVGAGGCVGRASVAGPLVAGDAAKREQGREGGRGERLACSHGDLLGLWLHAVAESQGRSIPRTPTFNLV